jgi:hypothetical protein
MSEVEAYEDSTKYEAWQSNNRANQLCGKVRRQNLVTAHLVKKFPVCYNNKKEKSKNTLL